MWNLKDARIHCLSPGYGSQKVSGYGLEALQNCSLDDFGGIANLTFHDMDFNCNGAKLDPTSCKPQSNKTICDMDSLGASVICLMKQPAKGEWSKDPNSWYICFEVVKYGFGSGSCFGDGAAATSRVGFSVFGTQLLILFQYLF